MKMNTNLTPTQKAIHDLREEFNRTDIQKIFEYIKKLEVEVADLKLRFEMLQNQVDANEKSMCRHEWETLTGINYDWKE